MKILTLIMLIGFPLQLMAKEKTDAFVVRLFADRTKVLAPSSFSKNMNVILENKTLVNIVGKIVNHTRNKTEFIAIEAGKRSSKRIKGREGDIVYFLPMSPPAQKIVLKYGANSYEIPPKE